jgi:hypothetical protein
MAGTFQTITELSLDDIRTRIAAGCFSERDTLILLLLLDISEKLNLLVSAMYEEESETEVGN